MAGHYCDEEGKVDDTFECDAGYYCMGNTPVNRPLSETDDKGDRCKAGMFCIQNSSAGEDCPLGTFSSARGLREEAECNECPRGYLCDELGLLYDDMFDNKKCDAGHYCTQGNTTTYDTKLPCDVGQYCPDPATNTDGQPNYAPFFCEAGTYQASTG